MQVVTGLLLVGLAACLLTWGAVAMRSPASARWTRGPFAAEMVAILLITLFAAGLGVLIDFVTSLSGNAAYAAAAGLVVAVPVLFVAVWRLSGAAARLAAAETAIDPTYPANDHRTPPDRVTRRRAA